MTISVFSNIQIALDSHLASIANCPPVAWPNVVYTPVENTLFLRPTILMSKGVLATFAGMNLESGIYQIDVIAPAEKGMKAVNTMLDNLYLHFKNNRTLTAGSDTVYIQEISRGNMSKDGAWISNFIEVNFLCYN